MRSCSGNRKFLLISSCHKELPEYSILTGYHSEYTMLYE